MKSFSSQRGWAVAEEEALQWLCDLREGGREERLAFVQWLKESPRHVRAFLMMAATVKTFENVGPKSMAQFDALVAQALASEPRSNVVALQAGMAAVLPSSIREKHRKPKLAVAAGMGILALSAAMAWWNVSRTPTYSTATGEQRTVSLSDGSTLHLNTRSRVQVRFSEGGRDIDLQEGEALFVVAKDPRRPFRVHSGASSIQAVGTQFNVLRRSGMTTVSVIEGVVQVEEPGAAPARLAAGEEAQIASSGRVLKAAPRDVSEAVAWRDRRLVFRSTRLADIAEQFNRYNERQIRIVGDEVKERRFTGTGIATSPGSFIQFLSKEGHLNVDITEQEVVVRDAR